MLTLLSHLGEHDDGDGHGAAATPAFEGASGERTKGGGEEKAELNETIFRKGHITS